jgi:hypothetical protein
MRSRRAGLLSVLSVLVLGGSAAAPPPAAAAVTVLVGAGDIARCGSSADNLTADLLGDIGGTVFTTGDNAYPSGSPENFAECYDPGWGRYRTRTRPSPGNHDYATPGASGYFDYFRWRAGPDERGYYVYTRGDWRIYSLNSEVMTTAQLEWLEDDLAAHPTACIAAYWHRPLFSSGKHGNNPDVKPFWRLLYRAGAEVVINGHDHDYERFGELRPGGTRTSAGIRQFVVGTGGGALRAFAEIQPHSIVRNSSTYGVVRLVLRSDSYAWQFIAVDGTVKDAGSDTCHARP